MTRHSTATRLPKLCDATHEKLRRELAGITQHEPLEQAIARINATRPDIAPQLQSAVANALGEDRR